MSTSQCIPAQLKATRLTGGLRAFLRDIAVECLALQPTSLKQSEMKYFRSLILGLLFRLERNTIVVAKAGPTGHRFRMRLRWRAHLAYVLGLYEPELLRVLKQHLGTGDTCIDLGAHVGYLSIIMARLVGPYGRVISFEPVLETCDALKENIHLNRLSNVTVERAAAGDKDGSLELICTKGEELSWTASATGYSLPGEGTRISVPLFSLDRYLATNGLRPGLIKIDVEGAELAVLQGARRTLNDIRPLVLLEIHDLGDEHKTRIFDLFKECRYSVTRLGAREREVLCLALPCA